MVYAHSVMQKILRQIVLMVSSLSLSLAPMANVTASAATCNYQQCTSGGVIPTVLVKQGVGRVLAAGDRGIAVTTLQKRLNKVLHSNLQVDGIFGQQTHRALLRLQSRTGELPTGVVAPQTWAAALGGRYRVTTKDAVRFGDGGPLVTRLQQLLNRHGYATRIDGVYRSETWRSVVAFKAEVGLSSSGTPSGVVSTRVWNALNLPHLPV